jgi:pyruvate dehydrogenase E2 component (dihydrolipoamide acetyltransferase)
MLGVTVENGKIIEWLKAEGDTVEKGESIFIVEAEKVTTEVESPASGILSKILLPPGEEVPVLTVVGVITDPGEDVPEEYLKAAPIMAETEKAAVAVPGTESVSAPEPAQATKVRGAVKIVPAARRLAQEKGIDFSDLQGTGPEGVILYRDIDSAGPVLLGPAVRASTLARRYAEKEGVSLAGVEGTGVRGRVMRTDVERAVEEAARPGLGKIIPMNTMRQVIARRMAESKFTAPHIYFFTDICMDALLNLRKEILTDFESRFGIRPSVNDFLIKAVALNILDFPMLNATLQGDEIHIQSEVNVCLAVALPDGLIVPAIANADMEGLANIVLQRMDLVERARSGKLTADELQRGTFTISSLAQYDITYFTAIINPPQCGILSIGKTRDELYMVEGEVKTRQIATFGLSVDHRIIDGAVAADFLQNLKIKLEKPIFTFLNY